MIKVLIVDDHDIVREGVKQIVADTTDIQVGGEARTGGEAIAEVRRTKCDVIVLDLNLPDRAGLEVLVQLRALAPHIPVLVFTMHQQPSYATRALKAGAAGYVSKDSARAHLVTAIRKVARGERFLAPDLAESVAFGVVDASGENLHEHLSDREFQVLCLIAAGKPPRQIASELNLSVRTVGTHRARLLAKMGLKNNAQLVQYALEHDLLPEGK
ncbi:MAG TPA: response regulator transcription factor [Thermoanaerobaculia bacterium]|nr:response regulator transcription factor [Thermoanaerobaculia bacterium]